MSERLASHRRRVRLALKLAFAFAPRTRARAIYVLEASTRTVFSTHYNDAEEKWTEGVETKLRQRFHFAKKKTYEKRLS